MSSKRASLGQRADGLLSVAANRTAQTLTGKTEREVTRLAIETIRRDGGTQPRAGLDQAVVEEYAEVIREGGALPPVEVVYDGTDYWLWDGYHRLAAAEQEGETEYDCFVTPGTRRDAVLKSVGANADHGLRRTDDDKRRAVEVLLADPEWSQWSDREIARQCKVSHPFVAKIRSKRAESTGNGFQLRGKKAQKRIGRDGKARDVSNIQAANQRRAEERQAQDEPGKTAQANAKLAAKIDELREAVLAVVKGRAPMTYREIEFAVNAYLGRIANPGLLSGAISVLTRTGSLQNVGGGRYALAAEEEPVQNGSDWLDTPVERGATPSMAIAANGAPAHSDDHDEALDAAYRSLAVFGQAVRHADESIRKLFEIRGIRALYALPPERMKQVYGDVTALRYLAEELSTYCDEQIKKLRLMARTGRPYDEEGGEA